MALSKIATENLPIASVEIVPVAGALQSVLDALIADLASKGVRARAHTPVEPPASAYDRNRGQWRAEALLALARGCEGERVLMVTAEDCYAGGLNFVFGIADSPGRAAVISLARLGVQASAALFRARVLKEAAHELGHTLGLPHCPDANCVMHFSNRLADTNAKSANLCRACCARLGSTPR